MFNIKHLVPKYKNGKVDYEEKLITSFPTYTQAYTYIQESEYRYYDSVWIEKVSNAKNKNAKLEKEIVELKKENEEPKKEIKKLKFDIDALS